MKTIATIAQDDEGRLHLILAASNGQTPAIGTPPGEPEDGATAPIASTDTPGVRRIKKKRPLETASVAAQDGSVMTRQKAQAILKKWTPKPGRPPADVREARKVLGLA